MLLKSALATVMMTGSFTMTEPQLSLEKLTRPAITPTNAIQPSNEMETLHNIFKGRNAMESGTSYFLAPDAETELTPEAAAVAQSLQTCTATETEITNGSKIVVGGSGCPMTHEQTSTLKQIRPDALEANIIRKTQNIQPALTEITGLKLLNATNKTVFILKKVGDEYEVVSMAANQNSTINTVFGNITAQEIISYKAATDDLFIDITVKMGNKTLNGTFQQKDGTTNCTINKKKADCEVLAYAYGYGIQ